MMVIWHLKPENFYIEVHVETFWLKLAISIMFELQVRLYTVSKTCINIYRFVVLLWILWSIHTVVVITSTSVKRLPLSVELALVVRSVLSLLVVLEESEEARPTRRRTIEHRFRDVYKLFNKNVSKRYWCNTFDIN